MNSKEEMLVLLNQYGMNSNYSDPWIYEKDGKVGLVYTFSHIYYGLLSRAVFFKSKKDAQDFVYQYWWYKKYGERYQVSLSLSNYEDFCVQPIFLWQGKAINSEDMKGLLTGDFLLKDKKGVRIYQRYLRTARMLVDIYHLKQKVLLDTSKSVSDLTTQVFFQENELIHKYNQYHKANKPLTTFMNNEDTFFTSLDNDELLSKLAFFAEQKDIEVLKKFINELWKNLFKLESDESHLKNKYLLIIKPLELEDIRNKKDYVDALLQKRKGFFFKKENLDDVFAKIDKQSEILKIIKMEDYVKNEKKRLREKYSIIKEMDYSTLGDYLNEFDNLGVVYSFHNVDENLTKVYSHEELLERFRDIYFTLSFSEQQILAIYHSFLQPICDRILKLLLISKSNSEIISMCEADFHIDILKYISILSDAENVMVRMRIMKSISLENSAKFLESLIIICKKLLNLQKFRLSQPCVLFGKSKKERNDYMLYHATCKSIGVPSQNNELSDIYDIFEIQKDVVLYFLPVSYPLQAPYLDDNVITPVEKREDILLILHNYQVKWNNSDIIKVAKYVCKTEKRNGIKEIVDIRLSHMDEYRHVIVS